MYIIFVHIYDNIYNNYITLFTTSFIIYKIYII